jgi:hypothetical protein
LIDEWCLDIVDMSVWMSGREVKAVNAIVSGYLWFHRVEALEGLDWLRHVASLAERGSFARDIGSRTPFSAVKYLDLAIDVFLEELIPEFEL